MTVARTPIYQVDAFTDRLFGGNPAAVMLLDSYPGDGVLQAQPRMPAGLPSQVTKPAAASSPGSGVAASPGSGVAASPGSRVAATAASAARDARVR